MMIERGKLLSFLDDYLDVKSYEDYAPNGLQVEGKAEIKRVALAVTASQFVINEAIKQQADAVLVHHGYFWKGEPAVVTGMKQRRLKALLTHDINLIAYHLPLDDHAVVGNNRQLASLLGVENAEKIAGSLLWQGHYSHDIKTLIDAISTRLNRVPQVINELVLKQGQIGKIAWCSGAADNYLLKAKAAGANVFISGEVSERTYYETLENDICYIVAGHYATEMFGVKALGAVIAEKFALETSFIFEPNPI